MNEVKFLQWTYSICILIVALVQSFIPKYSGQGVYLGVRFSKENSARDEIKDIVGKYILYVLGLGIVLAILMYFFIGQFQENYDLQIILFLLAVVLIMLPILWGNKKLKEFKIQWNDLGPKKVISESINVSGKKIGMAGNGLWLYLIPFIIIVLSSAYIINNYDKLPEMIPIHFNFAGQADSFSEKSITVALMPSLINLFMFATIFLSNLAYLVAKQRLEPEDPQGSLERYLLARRIWTIYFALITIAYIGLIQIGLTYLSFGNTEFSFLLTWAIIGLSAVVLIVSVILGVKVGMAGEKLPGSGVASYDSDDDSWKLGGLLYYNENDPSVFVYKRVGLGVTINLATLFGKLMLALFILIILLSIFFIQ